MKTKLLFTRSQFAALTAILVGTSLVGCSLDAEPQYIIVTGQPPTPITVDLNAQNSSQPDMNALGVPSVAVAQAEPTATNTPIPEPTTQPTLSIPPNELLITADSYRINGYYESAVDAYRALLMQGDNAPREVRAAAAIGMAQSAVREGFFDVAVEATTVFINQFADDSRLAQAHFLRGDAYMGLGRWVEAINDYSFYLENRPGLLDSYVRERIADALLALGQTDAALSNYMQAADAARSLVPQLALRERVAQVLIGAGRIAEGIEQYDAILAVAENAPYRAQIDFAAAQTLLINAGDIENGMIRMQRVFETYPTTTQAYQAMRTLVDAGVDVNNELRGRVSFTYGDYQGAIEAFNTHSTQTPAVNINPEMYLLLGRAYREIGNSQAALTAFQTIIDQYQTSPVFGAALLEQGRTRFLGGDIPAAIQFYLNIAETYPFLPETAEALWRAGFLYSTNGDPGQARLVFERLADQFPDSPQAVDGLFLAASAAMTTGDSSGAERFFLELMNKATGEDRANAALNAGRLALARGDSGAAQTAFQQAIDAAPDSYFSARAQDIALGRAPFAPPSQMVFTFDETAEIAEAENWLRSTFSITQEGELWRLSPELEADARIVRGTELWAVGAVDEARAEFSDIIDANQTNALASYQLAIYLRGLGAYQNSLVASSYVIRAAGVGTLDAPRFIARLRYPAYYSEVVIQAAERHGVDPLLLLSLIRHESLFDTYATAAAGEKGLTQVIPSTGEYIAAQINFPDYQHTDLFRPYAGIEFGAYYLGEQLRTFDGNVTASLAGYNAGPGRSLGWLEISGGDHDLFMTSITIDSTRTYVQRIYGFYNIYRVLYGA